LRFPKEVMDRITDQNLLDRYFWIKRLDAQKPHREIVAPIPWDEVQRVKVLVERVASDTSTDAIRVFHKCSSGYPKLPTSACTSRRDLTFRNQPANSREGNTKHSSSFVKVYQK
jgi:hypothetical protein